MNDEIGLDEDIEPTADASEGVKGGVAIPSAGATVETAANLERVSPVTTTLGGATKMD
jgi:hypothetical protein